MGRKELKKDSMIIVRVHSGDKKQFKDLAKKLIDNRIIKAKSEGEIIRQLLRDWIEHYEKIVLDLEKIKGLKLQ